MIKELTSYSRYVLSYRLLEFAEEVTKNEAFESLCPERIEVLDFDEEDLNTFKLVRSEEKERGKDRLKFYQSP